VLVERAKRYSGADLAGEGCRYQVPLAGIGAEPQILSGHDFP
jgi:hypothetical protein